MVVEAEQIVAIIRNKGPLLPATLAKSIGTDILIASAHLAYLVDSKKVLISKIKVGGSPVYYIDGQQERLQEFSSNLNEKDQKTLHILKSKKILKTSFPSMNEQIIKIKKQIEDDLDED